MVPVMMMVNQIELKVRVMLIVVMMMVVIMDGDGDGRDDQDCDDGGDDNDDDGDDDDELCSHLLTVETTSQRSKAEALGQRWALLNEAQPRLRDWNPKPEGCW